MNILLQSAGIAIMIVIFIFYFIDRKSAIRSNKLFLYQALAIFASLVIDILSLIAINHPNIFSDFITYSLCKIYLVTVILVCCFGFVYVIGDIEYSHNKLFSFLCFMTFVVLVISSALTLSLPLEITYDPEGLNDMTGGAPVIITYVTTFIMMGLTVFMALRFKNEIYEKRVLGVLIFITLWVLGAGIQGLFNYVLKDLGVVILSVSLAESLGSLVIYIMLEDPSLNVDKVTGALNKRAFKDYIENAIRKGIKKNVILLNYDNEMTKAISDYNSLPKVLVKLLYDYPVKIFKNDNNDFIIVTDDTNIEGLNIRIKNFTEKFYLKNNITSEIPLKIFLFNDLSFYKDASDFIDVMGYINLNQTTIEKNMILITKEKVDEVHNKFDIKKKCDKALANKKVVVYLQPIYSNINSKFTSAEALVRLVDDDNNLIYPGDFIEEMERDGKIIELGKIVFEDVCKFISQNDMEKLGLHYIEVNLSTIQCLQENLAETYIEIAKKYNVNPKYINLEITETGQIAKQILLKNIERLKAYGFSFSLDDFGTGNSNLNYIVDMPVEIVKFDKTMVNSYFDNQIASYVMNSTINMIKGLGYKIVFEGIETESQTKVAKEINIEYIQGYYYSRPINKEDFLEFIIKNNSI